MLPPGRARLSLAVLGLRVLGLLPTRPDRGAGAGSLGSVRGAVDVLLRGTTVVSDGRGREVGGGALSLRIVLGAGAARPALLSARGDGAEARGAGAGAEARGADTEARGADAEAWGAALGDDRTDGVEGEALAPPEERCAATGAAIQQASTAARKNPGNRLGCIGLAGHRPAIGTQADERGASSKKDTRAR